MNLRAIRSVAAVLATATALAAQGQLTASASVPVSNPSASSAVFTVSGPPASAFLLLADYAPGPREVLGVPLAIGVTPSLLVLDASVLGPNGGYSLTVQVPPLPILSGLIVYSQVVFPSATAPNGVFTASNGESTVLFAGATALVERFDNAVVAGFVGNYDASSLGRLRGVYSQRSVQPVDIGQVLESPLPGTVSPLAQPLAMPIQSPLDPRGCRAQFVYRAADLGADGSPEVLIKAYWRVHDGLFVQPDSFDSVSIRVSHSQVVPSFLVGSFSALPVFPASGLGTVMALNESSQPVLVRSGSYAIDPAAVVLGLDGLGIGRYLDWGIGANFVYNGQDSLLLDVRTGPSPGAVGLNGAQVHLAVQSDSLPASRCVARPPLPVGTIDPDSVAVGERDNAIHDMVFVFARPESQARSPFRAAGQSSPDYRPAILAASTPDASVIVITYRGADDALGTNATAFSPNIDIADGKPFLQYSIRLIADVVTGAVPSIDTLVIPIL